jgi:hypothetical protein
VLLLLLLLLRRRRRRRRRRSACAHCSAARSLRDFMMEKSES